MARPILLDTCALLWLSNKQPMASAALEILAEADRTRGGLAVSPISAWEIGQLVAKGRLILPMEPTVWFETALEAGIDLVQMPPSLLIAASFLPGVMLRDPADRIIAATARALGFRIMTRDRILLDFAAAGHAHAIPC